MEHTLCMSPLLQSHLLSFSQRLPFTEACNLLNEVLEECGANASQSQRLMQYFGCDELVEAELSESGFVAKDNETSAAIVYSQVDGGLILTDEGYKETKVGRIFSGDGIEQISSENLSVEKRNKLSNSDFIAEMGSHTSFFERYTPLLQAHVEKAPSAELVCISDGARWIENWQKEYFPQAVCILDIFHALEHLSIFAKQIFSGEQASKWIESQQNMLLCSQTQEVIENITLLAENQNQSIKIIAHKLIGYYKSNLHRMDYKTYLSKGYCIGSGAIESAVSTLLQQRCKLVGQRWTSRVNAVLNIRAMHLSKKWNNMVHIINHRMGIKLTA